MAVVNTNVGASVAQAALVSNARDLNNAMTQLSTGKRINSAGDDAAGLAVSNRMTSQAQGLGAAIRNANDAISMVQTAEGALDEITDMLQRMREISVSAASATLMDGDRDYLDLEYQALATEIERVADNTQWNRSNIIDGTTPRVFQIGANASQTVSVTFTNMQSLISGDLQSVANSNTAIGAIDTALGTVNTARATYGAAINQLTHAADNLTNIKINTEASRSRILDTDYAEATSELARTQIIQQAGTAMLAQANQLPQTVLALLQ